MKREGETLKSSKAIRAVKAEKAVRYVIALIALIAFSALPAFPALLYTSSVQRPTLAAGSLIVLILAGLGGADYWFKERPAFSQSTEVTAPIPVEPISQSSSSTPLMPSSVSSPAPTSSFSSISSISSSRPSVVKKGTSTKKKSGVNVDDVLSRLGLAKQPTNEASFLSLTMQNGGGSQATVLLWHDDRAFLFSWIEDDNAKTIFGDLKQALQEQFSGKLTDLRDETVTAPDGPPVNVLSFFDPALSAERIIFLRVRTRLYEIHVAKNGESVVERLVAELSK